MKRLLITGARGFVAGSVLVRADEAWEVHALSSGEPLLTRPGLHWRQGDVLDRDWLLDTVQTVQPDVILHMAAIASIDYCGQHREEALAVNSKLTHELAVLAEDSGARLVFVSTDNVFDGARGLYTEEDPPNPVNYYGETKVMAEQQVACVKSPWVIARTAIVMGLPMAGAGNSFLVRMLPQLERGETVGVPAEEVRSPIDVVTLGQALLELCGNNFTGYIHLAGRDRIDRCEMVRRIAAHLGYPPAQIEANDPTTIPGRSPRPRDVSLSCALAQRVLQTPMRTLEEGVELVVGSR